MNIKPVNLLNSNTRFASKRNEEKEEKKSYPTFEDDAPQIWFSDVIGPNGREMMGSHCIGFSDVIGEDGTRVRIFDVRC